MFLFEFDTTVWHIPNMDVPRTYICFKAKDKQMSFIDENGVLHDIYLYDAGEGIIKYDL